MSHAYVSHLAWALGSTVEDLETAAARGRLRSTAEALRDAGFERHHVCDEDEDAYALARRCFESARIDPDRVDGIVYATAIPGSANAAPETRFAASRDVKDLMEFPASRLQLECGMRRAFVVGLTQQACTGMLGSIRVARGLLCAEPDLEAILCITADRFPRGAIYEQAYNLVSDGAAACLVSREPGGYRYLASTHLTDGALARADDDAKVGGFFTGLADAIEATVAKAGFALRDARWVVPQNLNRTAWKVLSRILDVAPARAFLGAAAQHGHVIAADNVMSLDALARGGRLERGDRVVTFMAGFGAHWQCVALEAA